MAIAEITHHQVSNLLSFCQEHQLEHFAFSNDHGAYFCAITGSHDNNTFKNCVEYLDGMDPRLDADGGFDAHENASHAFGFDDFGVDLPVSWLSLFCKSRASTSRFRIKLTPADVYLDI